MSFPLGPSGACTSASETVPLFFAFGAYPVKDRFGMLRRREIRMTFLKRGDVVLKTAVLETAVDNAPGSSRSLRLAGRTHRGVPATSVDARECRMALPVRACLSEACAPLADLCFGADRAEVAEAFAWPSLTVGIARLARSRDDDLSADLLRLAASEAMREVAAVFDACVAELPERHAFFDGDATTHRARRTSSASRVTSLAAASLPGTRARRAEPAWLDELRIDGAESAPTITVSDAALADDELAGASFTKGEKDFRGAREDRRFRIRDPCTRRRCRPETYGG